MPGAGLPRSLQPDMISERLRVCRGEHLDHHVAALKKQHPSARSTSGKVFDTGWKEATRCNLTTFAG